MGWWEEFPCLGLPAIGFATKGIDEPHRRRERRVVCLIARGSSTLIVDDVPVTPCARDVIVVEPGDVHSLDEGTPNYFHFVLHSCSVRGNKVLVCQA
jgi:hypothetical protein